MSKYNLWDYQNKIEDEIDDFYSHGGKSLLVQAPTGTGKSIVMVDYIKRMREQSKPVYFVTHSKPLLWQFDKHLTECGLDHGVIAPGCPTLRYRVQVISAASLKSRMHMIDEPWGLIFEEAHHSSTAMFSDILKKWPHAHLLGLTATPARLDGKPLTMYEKLVTSPSVKWFIDNYYLSGYDYYIPQEFNTSGIHHIRGDFSEKELSERAGEDTARIGNLVEYYQKYSNNLPGIAFGTSIVDSENIASKFRGAGYDMKALHSKMTDNLDDVLNDCRDGIQSLISSCEIISEGVDVKGLTSMIDARPTESLVVEVQHWGRVLRAQYAPGYDLSTLSGRRAAMEAGGKGKAKILDFSSNYIRHGLPDDEREWSLSGGVKEKTESKYKRCPSCQRPIPNCLSVCPYCGYEFPRSAPEPEETPERDGELIPISELTYQDKNGLALRIAREAESLKDAVRIAKSCGVNQQAAWFVWRKLLKKEIEK